MKAVSLPAREELTDGASSIFPGAHRRRRVNEQVSSTMAPLQAMFVIESFGSRNQPDFPTPLSGLRHIPARTGCLSYFIFPKRKKGIIQFMGTP
jgi:hypothetical protein